jgi:hypothetical protein
LSHCPRLTLCPARYAFIPSQAPTPESANGDWTIWNGHTWDLDDRIRAIGTGVRKLHVGEAHEDTRPPEEDYDEEEYMRNYEERMRQEEEEANRIDEEEDLRAANPDGPQAVPKSHHVPLRMRYRSTCPEGHVGCRAGNMCRKCPGECATCQNLRYVAT